MADLFVSLVSLVPKPSTVSVGGPKADGKNSPNNGLISSNQAQQVMTAGK